MVLGVQAEFPDRANDRLGGRHGIEGDVETDVCLPSVKGFRNNHYHARVFAVERMSLEKIREGQRKGQDVHVKRTSRSYHGDFDGLADSLVNLRVVLRYVFDNYRDAVNGWIARK